MINKIAPKIEGQRRFGKLTKVTPRQSDDNQAIHCEGRILGLLKYKALAAKNQEPNRTLMQLGKDIYIVLHPSQDLYQVKTLQNATLQSEDLSHPPRWVSCIKHLFIQEAVLIQQALKEASSKSKAALA